MFELLSFAIEMVFKMVLLPFVWSGILIIFDHVIFKGFFANLGKKGLNYYRQFMDSRRNSFSE